MTWIKTIPYEQASPELKDAYQAVYSLYPAEYAGSAPPILVRPDGKSDSIVAAHSLIPEAMRHMMSGLGVLLQPNLPLTRTQQEMIASVVSKQNSCFYWIESHIEFLRLASLDEKLAAALRQDWTEADLCERDRAMLDFAVRLTNAAYKITPEDHERLRAVDFDDVGILQITLIASWFNYINRVADALGVGRPTV